MDLPPKHVDMDPPSGEGEDDDDEKYPILFLDVNLGKRHGAKLGAALAKDRGLLSLIIAGEGAKRSHLLTSAGCSFAPLMLQHGHGDGLVTGVTRKAAHVLHQMNRVFPASAEEAGRARVQAEVCRVTICGHFDDISVIILEVVGVLSSLVLLYDWRYA